MLSDRLPPHNPEAERAVLGSLLRCGTSLDGTFGHLTAADFYTHAHQCVYGVYADCATSNRPFDVVTCFEELIRRGQSQDVTSLYLAELFEAVGTAANLEYYAGIVREHAARRRVILSATELVRDVWDGTSAAAELLEKFYDSAVAGSQATHREPTRLIDALEDVMTDIDERSRPGGRGPIPTGFESLDNVLGGLRGGEFIVLAARPGVGKTALGVSMLLSAADLGVPGLMFSLEMGAKELASRVLSMRSDVPMNQIRGRIQGEQATVRKLIDGVERSRVPVWIDDRADHGIGSVTSVSRYAKRRYGVGLIVLDYLQLMAHEGGRNDTMSTRVGNTSRRLKVLARTLDVPVVCLAQLNRECESRPDKRPHMSDLRDSGNIEQDADVVLLLWPDAAPERHEPTQVIRVCVEKQRNGPRDVVPLDYRRAVVRFEQGRIGY